jgi:hypothetical protein
MTGLFCEESLAKEKTNNMKIYFDNYIPISVFIVSVVENPALCRREAGLLFVSPPLRAVDVSSRLMVSISRINIANASSKLF